LNYGYATIGDKKFLLPLTSELKSRRGKKLSWNAAEFRVYRKFGTESNITFDAGEPAPDAEPKQPAKPPLK
jgi:hypothetical protein